jgi:GNAT superfamily N-acetyltransferase
MLLRRIRDTETDAEAVQAVSAAAFAALPATPSGRRDDGEWPRDRVIRSHSRTRHLARTDPDGCWIALDEDTGAPLGVAVSMRREGTWGLSLLAVAPEVQGKGLGKALLDRALRHGRGCLRGIICGSADPRAARRYRQAGFTLHPTMCLTGVVENRTELPDPGAIPVHPGTAKHRDLLDSVDRRLRGGAHGPDHEELLHHYDLLVVDTLVGSGYCYTLDGTVELLAATSRRLATRLLTEALLMTAPGTEVRISKLTAEQEWAVDVGLTAGLTLESHGYLCLRGLRPPSPYIPSGSYL